MSNVAPLSMLRSEAIRLVLRQEHGLLQAHRGLRAPRRGCAQSAGSGNQVLNQQLRRGRELGGIAKANDESALGP